MVVWYSGKYCAIRQHHPSKPISQNIKIWCLADFILKYILNFDVYCSKNRVGPGDGGENDKVSVGMGHKVVTESQFWFKD